MIDDDIETLVPVQIPTGALAASAPAPSGWCLTLTRAETLALLRASPRWRESNELLGRAAMRTSNDRIVREEADVEAAVTEAIIPHGHEISALTFSHDGRNLVVNVKTRRRPRTINVVGASRMATPAKRSGAQHES